MTIESPSFDTLPEIVVESRGGWFMVSRVTRHRFLCSLMLLAMGFFNAPSAQAATSKVIKVLPHFLDKKGRSTLNPSLYERDAYQAELRRKPELRGAVRFDVQWKHIRDKDATLRLELRGVMEDKTPRQLRLEKTLRHTGWWTTWSALMLEGEEYKKFGDVVAWRVTLWDGATLLAEQRSFLW